MENLLGDILPFVADFLSPSDALKLSRTCRALQSKLSLTASPLRRILTNFVRHARNDDRHYGYQIPVPLTPQVVVHSILVSMTWKDQGWGNRKGSVYVVAEEEKQAYDRSGQGQELFGGGRVVYSSGIAPHESEQLSFTFKPRASESYHLWYKVGGGGGHSLKFSDVSVQALVFDNPSHCFGKACTFLERNQIFHPWDANVNADSQCANVHHDTLNTVLASTIHTLTHGLEVVPPMISFFGRYGISEADLSLDLMMSIEKVWHDWKQEFSIFKVAKSNERARTIAQGRITQGRLTHEIARRGMVVVRPNHR